MDKQLICKECGRPRKLGRKLCVKCNSKRIKTSNLKIRGTTRYMFPLICTSCSKPYSAQRKTQKFCSACWTLRIQLSAQSISSNAYVYVKAAARAKGENHWEHRRLVEACLKRKLTCHEIVHHIDDNPQNNNLSNLIIMTRRAHGRLHKYLDDQRVILEKSWNDNLGNCWNNLIGPMTTAWLETTGAKVIKISDIGQSAAEPLSNEEGSETSAPGTLTYKAEGEDTVQPTTQQCGL
jgi:hypothetical protein